MVLPVVPAMVCAIVSIEEARSIEGLIPVPFVGILFVGQVVLGLAMDVVIIEIPVVIVFLKVVILFISIQVVGVVCIVRLKSIYIILIVTIVVKDWVEFVEILSAIVTGMEAAYAV
jgi:hypothetical protein